MRFVSYTFSVLLLGTDHSAHDQDPELRVWIERSPPERDHHGRQGLPQLPLSSSHRGAQRRLWKKTLPVGHRFLHLRPHPLHQGERKSQTREPSYLARDGDNEPPMSRSKYFLPQIHAIAYFVLMAVSGIFCIIFR